MSEQTAAFRKVFEYSLLEAEEAVKHYRSLLGMPPVEDNAKYAEENTRLLQNVAQQKSENEVLHRKVDDLASKLCKSHRECAKLRNELKAAKEPTPKVTIEGFQIYYKNPVTEQIIKKRLLTKYEELESKYKAQCEINKRLLHRAATQKDENKILQGKVNDLDHKLRQACQERDKLSQVCQERDKLAEKLRRAEIEAQKHDLLLKKLSHLIYEETRC